MPQGTQPRRKRKGKYEGETYYLVMERGERIPKCKSCGAVVPLKVWWEHSCNVLDPAGESSKKSENQ